MKAWQHSIGALLLAFGPLAAAWGWGAEGHSIIAEIAQRRLSDAAAANVAQLLGPHASLASISSWADDYRPNHPETYNWHFVDIPRELAYYDESKHCAADARQGDCVVKELERLAVELHCAAGDDARRNALRFAVHFVGDIHQPLHAVAEQKGGNLVHVHGAIHGETCTGSCELRADTPNLHALWDTTLIRRTTYDWGAYVERLEQGWLRDSEFQLTGAVEVPADWAVQTHAIAGLVWTEPAANTDIEIDDAYYRKVRPFLDQQLVLGGVRLARFLNDAYASDCDAGGAPPAVYRGAETGLGPATNVGDAKAQAYAYHASTAGKPSRYELDQQRVADAAIARLEQRAREVPRPAIVLDIDETSLDNWAELKANDLGYIRQGACTLQGGYACATLAWDDRTRNHLPGAPAIQATLKLYEAARRLGVAVFFLTGRHESERDATKANLEAAGYKDGWTGLIMRQDEHPLPSAADFKAPQRARLLLQGYDVIVSVGDQPSDLAGGYAERVFLMPNPYYRIP